MTAALLCAGYTFNLWLTNVLRQEAGGVDTIWTANAFVIGAVLLLPHRWTPGCLAAGFLIQFAVVLAFGHTLFNATAYSLLNLVETLVVCALARRLNAVRLTTPGRFARLIFVALLPVLIAGSAIVGIVALAMTGEFPLVMVLNRLVAKFLGMSLVLPAILLLGRRPPAAARAPVRWEAAAAGVLAPALAALIFTPLAPVALLVMFPAVTLLGLRLGPTAVILAMVTIGLTMLLLTNAAGAPALLDGHGDTSAKIAITQVYLAMMFATGIITALTASHQQRLRALLANRAHSDRRARDRARAASEAKTEFLATMSHEIRTPLNSIIGFAQVLERTPLPEAARGHVGVIRRSGDALLTVVNDILDFSKVEAGRLELDPKPVDLEEVCQDALAIVGDAARRKGLTLEMTVTGPLNAAYLCDDHRLCQILLNFLNNAVKFTETGRITLSVSVTPAAGADLVRLAVTDTGVGIPVEAQAGLFQRFQQVDSSISRSFGGTGLGLAIARGLAEAMGGRVGVRSAPGEGSEFWVEALLPHADPMEPARTPEADQSQVEAHVLLVDDHPVNRELGVAVLKLLGCTTDVACDGREAVERARLGRYDVILMDLHMPGMDGLAATRAILALGGEAARTPIVAMSADVLPEQVALMRAAGMVDSVEKPINIGRLHACLVRWTGGQEPASNASAAQGQ